MAEKWSDLPFTQPHPTTHNSNADSCAACHMVPTLGGSSKLTVTRAGRIEAGKFIEAAEGSLLHAKGPSTPLPPQSVTGLRVSTNLLGSGYVEAIPDAELRRIAATQAAQSHGRIHGQLTQATALESPSHPHTGRFGWKSQHVTLYSFAADSLANELGVPNTLYPLSETQPSQPNQTNLDPPSLDQSETLRQLVAFMRSTEPIQRDPELAHSAESARGEQLFLRIGCAACHLPALKTAPQGTKLPDGTALPARLANKTIHPYSDFLLHDVGTGDGIVQHAAPQDADQSTANKFRTAPLWGVRYRSWLMHDGQSVTYHQAIERHSGEASVAVQAYQTLTPAEKHNLREFLNSL